MTQESDSFELPELAKALRAGYAHHTAIPASVEDAILSAASEKFTRRRRLRLMARWGTGLAAGLAAMIALVIWLNHTAGTKAIAKGDINADGQVNMIDALNLARHVAARDKPEKSWDLNNDGLVDQKDVDVLATASVSLKQGGLAAHSLPKLAELGITRATFAGSASADVSSPDATTTFAEANPTRIPKTEDRQ
jgi:hypothetical protein